MTTTNPLNKHHQHLWLWSYDLCHLLLPSSRKNGPEHHLSTSPFQTQNTKFTVVTHRRNWNWVDEGKGTQVQCSSTQPLHIYFPFPPHSSLHSIYCHFYDIWGQHYWKRLKKSSLSTLGWYLVTALYLEITTISLVSHKWQILIVWTHWCNSHH